MVDIAQLVSASDCGSEGRGFESHYPPHKKETSSFRMRFFLFDDGFEPSNATVRWTAACRRSRRRQLNTFRPRRKCNESHYPPQKQKPRLLPWFFVFGNKWIMGFERPLRKHAGGMFLDRGRIPGKPTASRKGCWRLSIFWCIQPKRCALYQLVVPMP